jgi:RimJ/RimL family protein N-acetyltransferase
MKSPIPALKTERLRLRAFSSSDGPTVQRLAGDRAIADTTLNVPHPYLDGMAESWIASHAEAFARGKGVTFAIASESEEVLGAVSLAMSAGSHQAELGYWIGRSEWNRGYCTEAARAVVRFAFEQMALSRVHSCHLSRNVASGRVLIRTGMTHEGCRREHVRKWDALEDLELYGILRADWERLPPG